MHLDTMIMPVTSSGPSLVPETEPELTLAASLGYHILGAAMR